MTVDMYNQSAFLVIKIAYMYYIENYSQNEIAKALQISVTTVSRMLKKAKQERIVEFVIRDPYVECISLEKELKETFGLKDVIIAPGLAVEAEDGNYLGDEESAKKLVALEGARYLQRIIKKNDVLGITWGSTIYRLINYLNPAQKVDATFVTLHGSIACCRNELDVRTLVLRMAKAFSGMHYYLLTEALMSSKKAADIIKQEKNNKKVFQMFDNGEYYDLLSEKAKDVPAGSNGVLFLPYLTGGYGDFANASGAFLNMTMDTNQEVLWRAVLEAIGYDYISVTDVYRAGGVSLDKITVTEGGSRSDLWNQIKADMLNSTVTTLKKAGGAVMTNVVVAAYAVGDIDNLKDSFNSWLEVKKVYTPDPENTKYYRSIYNMQNKLVREDMKPTFDMLERIREYK